MSRALPFDELPPGLRRKLGPDAQLSAFDQVDAEHRRNASRRKKVGNQLEQDLVRDHELYLRRGLALVEQQHPATRKVRDPQVPGGWRVVYTRRAACDWMGYARGVGLVLFDSKSWTEARYEHPREQWHQLEQLVTYARFSTPEEPVRAFLLLADQPRGLAYLVEGSALERHWRTGEPITLREGRGGKAVHHFPLIRRPGGLLVPPDVPTWDWLEALRTAAPPR